MKVAITLISGFLWGVTTAQLVHPWSLSLVLMACGFVMLFLGMWLKGEE